MFKNIYLYTVWINNYFFLLFKKKYMCAGWELLAYTVNVLDNKENICILKFILGSMYRSLLHTNDNEFKKCTYIICVLIIK